MFSGYAFYGKVIFPEIELNIPGIYSIEYYYHFNSKPTSCLYLDESMTIYFEYNNNKTTINHNNTDDKNGVWIKFTLNITTTIKNNLKVISFYNLNL